MIMLTRAAGIPSRMAVGFLPGVPDGDDRVVRVAAVLPGTGGQLVAIDVPPADASDVWWHDRVGDYLELVATEELEIGSVEVRCPDAATTARARILIVAALAERATTLVFEVTTRVR